MDKPELEDPDDLPDSLWEVINERLWHATSTEGLKGILEAGEIKIGNRYNNSLCLHLRCVSLFDFRPTAKNYDRQFLNWWGWFGHQQKSSVAVWLEIDRAATVDKVCDAGKMHGIWKENLNKQFIPGVEACHKGPIPIRVLKSALLIYRYDLKRFEHFEEVNEILIDEMVDFEKSLPLPEPEPFITMLEASPNQHHKNGEEDKT